eukprot:9169425-Pyramimonas_sp.AAC.1
MSASAPLGPAFVSNMSRSILANMRPCPSEFGCAWSNASPSFHLPLPSSRASSQSNVGTPQ